jgi:hypothetical protein
MWFGHEAGNNADSFLCSFKEYGVIGRAPYHESVDAYRLPRKASPNLPVPNVTGIQAAPCGDRPETRFLHNLLCQ